MKIQRRRIASRNTLSNTLNSVSNNKNVITMDEGTAVNAHGVRLSMSVNPESSTSNVTGFWYLCALPQTTIVDADMPNSLTTLEDDTFTPYFWAMGVFDASNETPWNHEIDLKTSRNLKRGARVQLNILLTTISGGSVRVQSILQLFTI